MPPTRVLIVGEDGLARAGLRALAESSGLEVGDDSATDGLDERALAGADAVVWDAGARGTLEGLREISSRLPVVAVVWEGAEQAAEALGAGARAVLLRDRVEERLAAAVLAAVSGLVAVDESLTDDVLRPTRGRPAALVEALTPREVEVLQLIASGLSNRRIGERLGISEHTAKFHVNAILGKLGASTRSEAVATAARLGLLLL